MINAGTAKNKPINTATSNPGAVGDIVAQTVNTTKITIEMDFVFENLYSFVSLSFQYNNLYFNLWNSSLFTVLLFEISFRDYSLTCLIISIHSSIFLPFLSSNVILY